MTTIQTRLTLAVALPVAGLALAGSLYLWLRFGMGVYFDAAMGALAGCLG